MCFMLPPAPAGVRRAKLQLAPELFIQSVLKSFCDKAGERGG